VGGAVAVASIAGAAVIAALAGGGSDTSSNHTGTRGGASSGGSSAGSAGSHDVTAGAISADYRGGHEGAKTCVSPTGIACTPPVVPWEPLVVRCTAGGCTVTLFDRTLPIGSGTTSYSTLFPYEHPDCGTAPVTGSLRGVGDVVTHGLHRPKRIVGTIRVDATAHVVPSFNCNGGVQEFRYDATAG